MLNFIKKYWVVAGIAVVFTTLAIAAAVFRFNNYESGTFDLGIFVQIIKNNVYGVVSSNGFPLWGNLGGLSQLAAHFSPILFVLDPFYKIWQSPITLLVIQAVLVGISGIEIYYLSRLLGLSHKIATFIEVVFFVNPLVWSMLIYDFHEICFAIPLVLLLIIGYFKKSWWLFGIGLVLALMVKEDVIVTIGILGMVLLITGWFVKKQHRVNRYAITMIVMAGVVGIVAFVVSKMASQNLSPQIVNFLTERYGSSNSNMFSEMIWYIRHMFDVYSIGQIFAYFAPLCFLPLICMESLEWTIPAMFVLLVAMITTWSGQHQFINQYGATAVPYLFTATVIAMKQNKINIEKNWKWIASGIGVAVVIVFFFTNLTCINEVIAPNFNNERSMASKDLNQVVDDIPKGANNNSISITGNNQVFPHLISHYDTYAAQTELGSIDSIWGYPQTITDYVVTDTNKLIAQGYTLSLTSTVIHNWDKETSQKLSRDSRYQLVDSVNGVELWKLKGN